jgi:hypothetical protein
MAVIAQSIPIVEKSVDFSFMFRPKPNAMMLFKRVRR